VNDWGALPAIGGYIRYHISDIFYISSLIFGVFGGKVTLGCIFLLCFSFWVCEWFWDCRAIARNDGVCGGFEIAALSLAMMFF